MDNSGLNSVLPLSTVIHVALSKTLHVLTFFFFLILWKILKAIIIEIMLSCIVEMNIGVQCLVCTRFPSEPFQMISYQSFLLPECCVLSEADTMP